MRRDLLLWVAAVSAVVVFYVGSAAGLVSVSALKCVTAIDDSSDDHSAHVCVVNWLGVCVGLTTALFMAVGALGLKPVLRPYGISVGLLSALALLVELCFLWTRIDSTPSFPANAATSASTEVWQGACVALNGTRGIPWCGTERGWFAMPWPVGNNTPWTQFGSPSWNKTALGSLSDGLTADRCV